MISRSRESADGDALPQMFQSRNRGSFDFKGYTPLHRIAKPTIRFNLVIEVLLISRAYKDTVLGCADLLFQSRNRGSFDFKRAAMSHEKDKALQVSIS